MPLEKFKISILSAKFDSIYTNQEHWPIGHSGQKGGEFLGGNSTWGGLPIWGGEVFIIQQPFKFFILCYFVYVLDNCWLGLIHCGYG